MVDINKQIAYWRSGAEEDWEVAGQLIQSGHSRHGLFFAHLTLEKTLKAHLCRSTGALAPAIHNLVRLAEVAELSLTDEQRDLLAEVNSYNIEGRYTGQALPPLSIGEAKGSLARIERLLTCLNLLF